MSQGEKYYFLLICCCGLSLVAANDGSMNFTNSSNEIMAEVAVVCDKDLADFYDNDRQKILDHLTILFWDIHMRFRTLTKTSTSFRVTSVTVVNSTADRAFLLNARTENGTIDYGEGLRHFSQWINSKTDQLPKFDISLALLKADSSHSHGSYSYRGTPCSASELFHFGTGVIGEYGHLSMQTTSSFSFATLFNGTDIDQLDNCTARGYILDNSAEVYTRQFFSPCTDERINDFANSEDASCLNTLDQTITAPVLDPDFDNVLLSNTNQNECKSRFGQNNIVHPDDIHNCEKVRCQDVDNKNETYRSFSPFDNTICDEGRRCFRGSCIEPGSVLVNVKYGKCLQGEDRFSQTDKLIMTDCPRSSTPTERFIMLKAAETGGIKLATYFMSILHKEIKQKCLHHTRNMGGDVSFSECIAENLQIWELMDAEDGKILLRHQGSGGCLRSNEDDTLSIDSLCDEGNDNFLWRFEPVYPETDMCGYNGICRANLNLRCKTRIERLLSSNTATEHAILDILMKNLGEPAIAPAVTISWREGLKLDPVPSNCVFMFELDNVTSYKCKLGYLLQKGREVNVTSLQFTVDIQSEDETTYPDFKLTLVPSTASEMTSPAELQEDMPIYADIFLEGGAVTHEVHLNDKANPEDEITKFGYTFQVHLDGYIEVHDVSVRIAVPESFSISNGSTIRFKMLEQDMNKNLIFPPQSNPIRSECHPVLKTNSRTGEPIDTIEAGIMTVSCDSSYVNCIETICHFENFMPEYYIKMDIQMQIETNKLEILQKMYDLSQIKMISSAKATLPKNVDRLQPPNQGPDSALSLNIFYIEKEEVPVRVTTEEIKEDEVTIIHRGVGEQIDTGGEHTNAIADNHETKSSTSRRWIFEMVSIITVVSVMTGAGVYLFYIKRRGSSSSENTMIPQCLRSSSYNQMTRRESEHSTNEVDDIHTGGGSFELSLIKSKLKR